MIVAVAMPWPMHMTWRPVLLLVACSPTQIEPNAVKHCLEKDWVVIYKSTSGLIKFECVPPIVVATIAEQKEEVAKCLEKIK